MTPGLGQSWLQKCRSQFWSENQIERLLLIGAFTEAAASKSPACLKAQIPVPLRNQLQSGLNFNLVTICLALLLPRTIWNSDLFVVLGHVFYTLLEEALGIDFECGLKTHTCQIIYFSMPSCLR